MGQPCEAPPGFLTLSPSMKNPLLPVGFGYALLRFDFSLSWLRILWAVCGIALIGLMNLVVSFALALRTALGARGVQFEHWGKLAGAIGRRMIRPRACSCCLRSRFAPRLAADV